MGWRGTYLAKYPRGPASISSTVTDGALLNSAMSSHAMMLVPGLFSSAVVRHGSCPDPDANERTTSDRTPPQRSSCPKYIPRHRVGVLAATGSMVSHRICFVPRVAVFFETTTPGCIEICPACSKPASTPMLPPCHVLKQYTDIR